MVSPGRVARQGALAGLLLHTLAVGLVWATWELGLRGGVVTWMDFPVSILYLGFAGKKLLWWSLLLGGLQWACVGALLTYTVGRVAARAR